MVLECNFIQKMKPKFKPELVRRPRRLRRSGAVQSSESRARHGRRRPLGVSGVAPRRPSCGCDCFLRRLEAEFTGVVDEVSDFLRHHKVIGFNTYGEQFDGMHINQTFTGVVIGQPDAGYGHN